MISLSSVAFVLPLLLAGVSTGVWTHYDASNRNAVYAGTIAAIVTVFVPAVLVYLYYRDRIGPRTESRSTAENVAGAIAVGSLTAVMLGQFVAPPEPETLGPAQSALLPVGIAFGFLWMYEITPRILETT
jgi:sec-independent protein translocase protein TatC